MPDILYKRRVESKANNIYLQKGAGSFSVSLLEWNDWVSWIWTLLLFQFDSVHNQLETFWEWDYSFLISRDWDLSTDNIPNICLCFTANALTFRIVEIITVFYYPVIRFWGYSLESLLSSLNTRYFLYLRRYLQPFSNSSIL